MFNKIIAASAVSLLLASGALAQTSGGDTQGSSTFTSPIEAEMMGKWPESVRGAFFADNAMTLRTQEEITTSFGALTPEEQQAVRDDCTTVSGDTSNSYGKSTIDLCTMVGGM
jgi:hypothetical protein